MRQQRSFTAKRNTDSNRCLFDGCRNQDSKKDWDNKQAQLAKFNLELGKLSESIQEQESILAKQRKENAQADRLIEKNQQVLLDLSEKLKQTEGQKMFCRSGQSIHKKLARISNFISRSTKKVKHFEKLQESLMKEAAEKETEIQKLKQIS